MSKYPDRQLYCWFNEDGTFAGAYLGGIHTDDQIDDAINTKGAIAVSHEDHALYQDHQYIPDGSGFWAQHLYYVCRDGKPVRVAVEPTTEEIFSFYQGQKIADLSYYLTQTDYKQIQFMDGRCTAEEYAPIKSLRLDWNTKIRALKECKNIEEVNNITYEKYVKGA